MVLIVLCFGVFAPYVRFHILLKLGLLSGRLLGNSYSLGLRYVLYLEVPDCVSSFFPTSFFFFLIAPFPDHCLLLPHYMYLNAFLYQPSNVQRVFALRLARVSIVWMTR